MAAKTSGLCEKLRSALSSLCCESAVVTLTVVSVLAILGEILVNYGVLKAPADKTDPKGVSDNSNSSDDEKTMEVVEKVFHYTSLSIAGIFFFEIVLKLASFRMRFLVNPWQVMDMLVVLATVMVEVAFEIEGRLPELEACTFVVIFRLWRLPHACNIKAKQVQRDLEQDLEFWKAGKHKLEDKCNSLDAKHSKQKEKIERLERELLALKKETKENLRYLKQSSEQAPSANGSVPRDTVDGFSSNHVVSNHHVISEEAKSRSRRYVTSESEDEEDTIDGSPRRTGREETEDVDRETEEDTVEEEEESGGLSTRNYFRSGSESSLSCQAQEHEVHVQIEDQDEEKVKVGMTSPEDGVDSQTNSQVQLRRSDRRKTGDKDPLITSPPAGREVYYENEGYNPDLEDGEDDHGILVHEIDGAKTYRSAEGIPMTDL